MNFNKVLAVRNNKTVYRDGDDAVKVFDGGFSKVNILNEAMNHAQAEETSLNVPKLKAVTTVTDEDGATRWAIVMEHIPGQTLAALMEQHPEKTDEYLELFVDLQLSVHAQKAPLLTKLKDKMNRKISQTDLDATTRYELHTRLEGMPKHDKVCHGDFNPGNVIIADSGEAYVIDWSHATQGNASADAARTYLLFNLAGDEELADKYLDLFCKKSDTARQYVQRWLPIVAASQSVKGKAHEREFLRGWTDVVEYE